MTFGQRTALPPLNVVTGSGPIVRRRGGYPLAVLAVATAAYACIVAMTLTPYFNPTGNAVGAVLRIAMVPVLNVVVIAAVVLLLVDILFRVLRVSAIWAYGALSGGVVLALSLGLLSLTGSRFDIAVVVMVIPTVVGGCVLGLFRRRR